MLRVTNPSFGLTIALLLLLIGVISFTFPYFYRKSIRSRNDLIARILAKQILLENEKKLAADAYSDIPINVDSRTLKKIFSRNNGDYEKIQTYYSALMERNSKKPPKSALSTPEMEQKQNEFYQNNAKLMNCADDVKKIDWTTYNVDILHPDGKIPDFLLTNVRPSQFLNFPQIIIVFIPVILISWSVSSYVMSGDPLRWTVKFEIVHWLIVLVMLILLIVIVVRTFMYIRRTQSK